MNPFSVLGVPREADDAAIRQAYLAAIQRHGPETDPERFKVISAAYQAIASEEQRIRLELFGRTPPGDSPMAVFRTAARDTARANPMPLDAFKRFLESCSKP